jgi:hypothetical protein
LSIGKKLPKKRKIGTGNWQEIGRKLGTDHVFFSKNRFQKAESWCCSHKPAIQQRPASLNSQIQFNAIAAGVEKI